MRFKKSLATAMSSAFILGGFVSPAGAAEPEPLASSPVTCEEYSASQSGAPDDWACFNDIVTHYSDSGAVVSTEELTGIESSDLQLSPFAVADAYTSNVTERVYASLGGVAYDIPVSVKTRLYNHSARLTMGYQSATPVSLLWSLRIRRDNTAAPDDTVFTYPDAYGNSYLVTSSSHSESEYGDGYNLLPYDGKKYFIDLYALRISNGSKILNVAGSVQSDRMTCFKTVSCKF